MRGAQPARSSIHPLRGDGWMGRGQRHLVWSCVCSSSQNFFHTIIITIVIEPIEANGLRDNRSKNSKFFLGESCRRDKAGDPRDSPSHVSRALRGARVPVCVCVPPFSDAGREPACVSLYLFFLYSFLKLKVFTTLVGACVCFCVAFYFYFTYVYGN